MAEVKSISVDTNADGVPEEIVRTDAGDEPGDEPGDEEQEAPAWQPGLSEIKMMVGDLSQTVKRQAGELQNLTAANAELAQQLRESHQTILDLSDRIVSQMPKAPVAEITSEEKNPSEASPSEPREPLKEIPNPEPEKPRARRRSI